MLALADEPPAIDAAQNVYFPYVLEIEAPDDLFDLLDKHLDLSRMETEKRMTREQLLRLIDNAPEAVSGLLSTEGYFSPTVKIKLGESSVPALVSLYVDAGQPTLVRNVDVNYTGDVIPDEARMKRLIDRQEQTWPLPKGSVFRQSAWDDGKRRVISTLLNRRYPAAKMLHAEASVDPENHTVDLTVDVDSGPAYYYGPLSITGLSHYPEKLVRNNIQFHEGAEYRRNDLLELQTYLQNLPHFSLVLVDVDLPTDPPYIAPVKVTVQEAPLSKISTGLGFSTNTGVRGSFDYRYLNLLDRAWVLDTGFRLQQKEQSFNAGVTFPRFASGYVHRVYGSFVREDIQGLATSTWKTGVSRSISDESIDRLIAIEYQMERRELNDGTVSDPQSLTAKYQWVRRDVDRIRNPRSGNVITLEGGGALKGLLSDESFVRLYGRGVQFWPVGEKSVVVGRLELGDTFTKESFNVPSDWLFRTGGSSSVRGYDYQSLGLSAGGSTIPGRVMAVSSLEFQTPVYKDWLGAVFVDHGGVGDQWKDWRGSTGVGLGARWVSPVGVIGLDVARGVEEKQFRVHFSMGVTF
ncbi:autotransporter assembly complex protein TamA [Janthinobacterium sp. B9-8]|uniref:autotransporter assembly complex protein TamA n=1 Tax=Janthinobacterium sp. B9-8 TaxID=1236179 RepID=UPI0018D26313|nr:autotransporter assembly complex family protein [Janthinobacterium sp. B9-8]